MEYIQISELAAALSKVKGRVIVIMDSCHSGAAIGKSAESEAKAWSRAVIEAFSGYTVNGTKSGELAQSKFIVIAAAHSSQYSWDGSFDGSGYAQGAFTSAIIKGMACTYPNGAYTGNSMPADSNSDKLITLKELYDYAQKTAYNWTSSTGEPQQAQYWGNDSEVLFRRK